MTSQKPNSNALDDEKTISATPNAQTKFILSILITKNAFNASASRQELRAHEEERKAKIFVSCEKLFNFFHCVLTLKPIRDVMRLFLKMSEHLFRLFLVISGVNHDQHWPCACVNVCVFTPYLLPLSPSLFHVTHSIITISNENERQCNVLD